MDIKSYLAILNGNKWVILATLIVTVATTTVITYMMTPIYTASTTLRVATASSGVVGNADYMVADRLMNTYTRIATSGPVMKELASKLKLKKLPDIQVDTIPNTELIIVTVQSPDPEVARNSANTLAEILTAQGKALYSGGGKSAQDILSEQLKQTEAELNQARQDYNTFTSQNPDNLAQIAVLDEGIRLKEKTHATLLDQYDQARLKETIRANIISVVEPATLPVDPTKPNKPLNIILGAIVGLTGGVCLAFFFESLNSRLYTTRQIEAATDLSTIGKIPNMPVNRRLKLPWFRSGKTKNPTKEEAFCRLQVKLTMMNQDNLGENPLKALMITSSEPGEGKSTIAANLAITVAQSGKKVILMDCDFHIPSQHKINGLTNHVGLSSVMSGEMVFDSAVQVTQYPGLHVLTSGPLPVNPAKVLASPQVGSLIKQLTQQYDLVLVDTPACLAVSDTAPLVAFVDGVALVVRRNFIKEEAVREACRHLADIKARVIGLIVNDAEIK